MLAAIGVIVLFVFGWQMAKLFDERFIANNSRRAIPPHSGYNSNTLDSRVLIESMQRRSHGTTRRIEAISDGRSSDRHNNNGHHLAQARTRGHGQNVLPHDPRGDV